MARIQFVELHDLPACPPRLRRYLTDYLEALGNLSQRPYEAVAPRLRAALAATGERTILDLCSGSGGPLPTLLAMLRADGGPPVTARLTDLHPHWDPETVARVAPHGITVESRSVNALAVPPDLPGFRLICNAFHHFRPDQAQAILADAVRCGRGIAVLEVVDRTPIMVAALGMAGLANMAVTPFIRPFRWSRLLLTYPLPVVPMLATFDGVVSTLRAYRADELRALVAGIEGGAAYDWQIEQIPVRGTPVYWTLLVGVPRGV